MLFAKLKIECKTNLNKYYELISELNLFNVKLSCLKLSILHYYLVSEEYIEMSALIRELEQLYEKNKNYIRLADVYNYEIILYSYASKKPIDNIINKVNIVIKENDLPDLKTYELYSNIASYYHHKKDFEKALKYYEMMLDYYDCIFIPHLIYLADCQNHLNLPIKLPKVSKEILIGYPMGIRLMFKYFTLDESVPDFVKQNFIIKRILPKVNDEIDIDIFRYELTRLVERTGHYKSTTFF